MGTQSKLAIIITGDGKEHFDYIRNKLIKDNIYTIWISGETCNVNNIQMTETYSYYRMIFGLCTLSNKSWIET